MSSQPASAPVPLSDKMEETPLRVVLLGKTGSGKSSLGNTLMGVNVFKVDSSSSSGTSECKAATRSDGEITVIDTPGFFDTQKDEENLKPEIIKSIVECSPGPHAFLISLKVEKYTEHEKQVITKIKECFSEEAFKYAVLVFTHGDQLDDNMSIKDFVRENEDLQELSEKCGGRCHVIDNKYWKNNQQDPYRNNQFQVRELLNTIKEMVKQNGGCYTNQMLRAVERNIEQKERTVGSREEAKKNVFMTLLKMAAGIGTGVLLGALLGAPAMVAICIKEIIKQPDKALQIGCTAAAVGGVLGATVGGFVGCQEALDADSPREAAVNTARTLTKHISGRLCVRK